MSDEFNFDPDSVTGEDDQLAELDAFLIHLKELKEKPHIQMTRACLKNKSCTKE